MSSETQDTVKLSQILNPYYLDDDQYNKIANQFTDKLTALNLPLTELLSFPKKWFTRIVEDIVKEIDTYKISKWIIRQKICSIHDKHHLNISCM